MGSEKGNPPTGRYRRRTLLKTLGSASGALGLAGCMGLTGDERASTPERTATDSPTATPTATEVEDTPTPTEVEDTPTATATESDGEVEILTNREWAAADDAVVQALYDAGLSEDVDVEIRQGDFQPGERRSGFRTALEAGRTSPDIFMMSPGWTMLFIVRDQLANLSERLSTGTLEYVQTEYYESAVETASHPETGDLYGLPLFVDVPVIHYRKDLVEAAGYDTSGWGTEPTTWKRFAEVVADVWDQHSDLDYGYTTQGDNYVGTACCTFNEMMTSWGGAYFGDHSNLFGPVGDRPITVDEQPVIDTIRMMRSFMEGPDAENAHPDFPKITTTDVVDFYEESSREPFTGGDAAFNRNWPYAIPINLGEDGYDPAFDPSDYDVMPMPYRVTEDEAEYEGTGGTSHALGAWHLTVNPNSENGDQAIQVLEAFASQSVMTTVLRELGDLPPDPAVNEQVTESQVGGIADFLDTLAVAGRNAVPRPVTTAWQKEKRLISEQVNAAYRNVTAPERAMSDLATELARVESG